MLTEDQAKAAAQALLSQPQADQDKRTARLAAAKKRHFPPIKWLAVGSLSGMVVGAVAGFLLTGEINPWSIYGLSMGMTVGIGIDGYRDT